MEKMVEEIGERLEFECWLSMLESVLAFWKRKCDWAFELESVLPSSLDFKTSNTSCLLCVDNSRTMPEFVVEASMYQFQVTLLVEIAAS